MKKYFVVAVLGVGGTTMIGVNLAYYDPRPICMTMLAVSMLFSAARIWRETRPDRKHQNVAK